MNWLLLRGLAREQRHWGAFPDVLRARLPGDELHMLDLPGTGTEHRRASPSSIRAIAQDLRARWLPLREKAAGPWGVVAASLGGMVAMQWCSDHAADFERAVLLNTSAGNLSVPWRRLDLRVVPKVVRTLLLREPLRRQRNILEMTTTMVKDLDGFAQRWAAVQSDAPIARATVVRQIWAGARFRAPERVGAQVLVLSGAHDLFVDPECPRRVAAHLGGALQIHPAAGHDLPLDAPEWVADRIADWLGQQAVARAS